MPFCPNFSNPKVKQEFGKLTKKHGENLAYYLWDKYQGVVPTELIVNNTERIENYFTSRFGENSVFIKDGLSGIPNMEVLGYVEGAAAYLERFAPIDTAYHEGFHLFFRTTLNDTQRAELYKDAEKRYGAPTAEEIKNAKRGQKNISEQDARLLALEEKMAEEFRFYAMAESSPKGTPKRLVAFFKNLWAYIEALVGMPLTTRQAYRMLESNKIPTSFKRNVTQFKTPAFMIKKFASNPLMHAELTRVGASLVVDSYDKLLQDTDISDRQKFRNAASRKARQLMGNQKSRGRSEVREYFLRLSLSYEDGSMVTKEDFETYRTLYEKGDTEALNEFLEDADIYTVPPTKDRAGSELSKMFVAENESEEEQERLEAFSDYFGAIYDYWYDQKLESGRVQTGFRSDIAALLPEFGFSLSEKDILKDDLGEVERIYSISRLEQDPGKTLTQKQRILLSRIPIDNTSITLTGIRTYIPAMEVYRAVLDTVVDSENFTEMLNKLQAKGARVPSIKTVYNFINGLPIDQQASLFYAFNLASQDFLRIEIESQGKGKNKTVTSRLYSPNTGSILKAVELTWRKNSLLPSQNPLVGGLFQVRDEGGFRVDHRKLNILTELAKDVGIAKGKFLSTSLNKEQQAKFAELLMTLGMKIAPSLEEAIDRVQTVFKDENFNLRIFLTNKAKIPQIIKGLEGKEYVSTNFFEDEGSTIKAVIETFVAPFETAKSTAFVNSLLKSIYPINTKSRLNNEEKRIKNGKLLEDMRGTLQHDVGGRTSMLFKMLSNPKFVEAFGFKTLEAFGEREDDDVVNSVVEEMNFENLLATKLNAWYNKGRKTGEIALDTMGDRKRFVFSPMPRLHLREEAQKFGIEAGDFRSLMMDEMWLDINRMRQAIIDIQNAIENKSIAGLVEGYHYRIKDGEVDYSIGGWRNFNTMDMSLEVDSVGNPINSDMAGLLIGVEMALKEGTALIEKDQKVIDELVDGIEKAIKENSNALALRIGGELNDDGTIEINKESSAFQFLRENLDNNAIGTNPIEFLEEFAQYDYIGRIVTRSMFRGGVNFTKNGADYVKRAQLITTPGTQGILKGDIPANKEYGLSPTFNASTVRDIIISLPEEDLALFKEHLEAQVGERAAEDIIAAYRNIESTDAQAFITPKHFYEIMQSKGKVDEFFEEIYAEYLETGKWDPRIPIAAMKPSYDGTVKKESGDGVLMAPYSDKTSYITLTKELVEGIPILEELLDRMEAVGEYEGMKPIDVLHTESAQKLSIVPAHQIRFGEARGQFSELVVQEMDSQFLRFPEEVPIKQGKEHLNLGHQAKVNMLTNIIQDGVYVYNDGLEFAHPVIGEQLQNVFHSAIGEKMKRSLDQVHKDLGYDKVLEAQNEEEREEAMAKFIPKLTETLQEMSLEKDYNEGTLDALAIADGASRTALSFGNPALQGKFDQLIFSIYRDRVYRHKVKGTQMVQFAEFTGGVKIDEGLQKNLKFLTVEGTRVAHAEVDIRVDFLEKIGIDSEEIEKAEKTGDVTHINEELRRIIGYRIPQQGKSSMLIMKIRRVLPRSHDGVIRVPPGITTQMGSDFDIDKMFILFPELTEIDGKTAKLRVPYKNLLQRGRDKGKMWLLTDEQLNQILFDTFEAVASNINHLHETISPLDGRDLKTARDILQLLSGEEGKKHNIFSTIESINSTVRNMLSHRLRGVWAEAVLGRNVVMGAQVSPESLEGETIRFIENEKEIISTSLQTYALYEDVTGTKRPTDYFMSLHLGAAVDSVKDPLQEDINDNVKTFKIESYLYARGLTPRQVSIFLNHPEVRKVTELANKKGESIAGILKLRHFRGILSKGSSAGPVLNFTKMREDIAKNGEGKYKVNADFKRELLHTLKAINTEANDLYNLYSAVTAFTIDKSGTTAQNLEKFDRIDYFLNKSASGSIYGGKILLSEILESEAYLYSRGAWEAIQIALDMTTAAGMLSNQNGFKMFRKALMEQGKGSPFRESAQKIMLNAVNHHLITKPGSPLFEQGFLDKTLVESLFFNKDEEGSILYEFDKIKKLIREKGRVNSLIAGLGVSSYKFASGKEIHYLEYNNRKQRDAVEENAMIAGWEELYFNTSNLFTEEEAILTKEFAKHLLTNSIVTTGFGPGPRSMINILPPSIQQDIGMDEFHAKEIEALRIGSTELTEEFLEDFLIHYGTAKYRGETFVSQYTSTKLKLKKLKNATANTETVPWNRENTPIPPPYIFVKLVGLVEVEADFFGENPEGKVTFTVLKRRSARGRFYEHNLRTEENTVFDDSLISKERELKKKKLRTSASNKSARKALSEIKTLTDALTDALGEDGTYTEEQLTEELQSNKAPSATKEDITGVPEVTKEDFEDDSDATEENTEFKSLLNLSPTEAPQGVQAKIVRLTSSFAAAGVDAQFVLADLPQGTKGMAQSGIITIDPAQVREDTVYHEAGHILIDMLSEEDVRQYIKQVEAARPDIAEMVRNEYAHEGLSEFEMGKEILVTAIGLEGAKIERKNPSKLQIIINRILRALGKLFGIQPDMAAVLAEKMFAGDIKSLILTKEFNPRIQKSKKLEKQIDGVFIDAYQNLERQIRVLKFKPESKHTRAEILKIKQLQTTLSNMSENKATIDAFFTFSAYVLEQTEIAKMTFEKLRKFQNTPVKKEQALELLNEIDELNHTMSTFFDHKNRDKSLLDSMYKAVTDTVTETKDIYLSKEVLDNLRKALSELTDLEKEYADLVAPLVADSYAAYIDSSINEKIDNVIEATRKTQDTSGLAQDVDYKNLKKKKEFIELEAKKAGLDPKTEWRKAVIELKIEKLQAKKLNRATIIKELKDSYVDKSSFSLWLDPIVYSSEANLQMFAMAVNEGDFKSNRESIALINSAADPYKAFSAYMGNDTNKSKFYKPFLTTVTIRQGEKTLKLLSLVQTYDTELFYSNLYSFLDQLAIDTKRPEYDPTSTESKKKYEKWAGGKQGAAYSSRKAAWFAENTVEVEGARGKINELRKEKKALIEQKLIAELNDKPADAAVIQEYINDIETRIRSSYHFNTKTYMGELAQPKGWKGKPFESERLYASEKYEKIQSTPELKEMYDFLLSTYKEKQKPYGQNNPQFTNLWDDFSYIAPSVRQSNIEAVGRMGLEGVITELGEAFVRTDTDQELYGAAVNNEGESERYLPRYYTNAVDEKDVTRDILSSILMFSHRSNQYIERSKLVGLVNTMERLYKERRLIQKDESGGTLLSREAVKFKKNFENYAIDTTATISGRNSNSVEHLMNFIDSAFYGIHKKKLETKIMGMDPNKVVGTINSIAALGSLSFNFLQIGNQYILDNLMAAEEAVAGEFYSKKDLAWATKMLIKNGSGLSDIGKFTAESKLGRAMLHFDALVEVTNSLGRDASSNKLLKTLKTGNLLAFQGAVEYETAAKRMLASMKALEGKFVDKNGRVIKNEDGSDANLWDLMLETKKGVELDPRVDKEKSGFNEAMFMAKLRGLYKRTNQVKGNFDGSALSRTPFGAFLMLFKNYFIPGWRKRWGHGDMYHKDLELGTVTKGMYFSIGNYLRVVYRNNWDFRDIWENTSDVDKRNIKRSGTEALSIAVTFAMFSALMSILDDDDEDSYSAAFAAYQARRLQTELFAYLNPYEALRMFVSPMAAANRMQKWGQLISHFFATELRYDASLLLGIEPPEGLTKKAIYQRDTYWGDKGDRKIWGKIGKVTPIIYGFSTTDTESVEDKIRFFDN
tara:strand:- start:4108 stop:15231 length:11124 start_codon:yes stop_codon:yes gene_type:complete